MFWTEGTKYHPLFEHLLYGGHGQVTMTFAEIAAVIEAKLPRSAFTREEWWSNSPNGHSQARAWMRASYRTSGVDLAAQRVTFTLEGLPERYAREKSLSQIAQTELNEPPQAAFQPIGTADAPPDHPLFGIWEGRVHLVPGHDYTKPAFDPGEADGD